MILLPGVFPATDIEGDEFEGVDEGLAAFIDREQADSEEGAKDPNNPDDHPT